MTEQSGSCVLVTGALGQIGTELVPALRQRHGIDSVIATDLREISDHSVVASGIFTVADVLDKNRLEELIISHSVDTIYHLAAILSATGENNPELCERVNLGGLANVLELAKEHNLRLYTPSSIAVFGPDCPPLAPQVTPLNPTTMYGMTKVAGEVMANYYWENHGVDVRGIRYPGLISWKAPPGGGTTDYAVEIFHHAVESGNYTCFVKPDTKLPMMYMDDAIRATLELMDAPIESLGTARAGYNIAGISFTAEELSNAIVAKIPNFVCGFEPDIRQKYADSWPESIDDSFAQNEWGWSPKYNLQQLVEEMLKNLS
ncbi:MAG: NAD-dependent epimerase/dehydratase family protein [Candidatus Thalassarchaeaceae archaeon]|jgi:nucleoside-diphosphate-sugar epimerase|nr:NAD-dependent epimerase/dehydratase family protein [Candidatus Thalassarchaeaceae archaeon]MDP7043844.1 NAD-dependent epimerase/dehydratase family protein [Candidatus Thalassarchaeaceae archaeon]